MGRLTIQATPFFPGWASGRVSRDPEGADRNTILLLTQAQVTTLTSVAAAGLVIVGPAPLSHPLIKLLQIGVPTVLVTHSQGRRLVEGMHLSIDGGSGRIDDSAEVGPELVQPPVPVTGMPVSTQDGVPVELRASVADSVGAARAASRGAASIGLVRSEFLVPEGGREPDAGFYKLALLDLCQASQPLPVIVRLLDLAADKRPAWLALDSAAGLSGALGVHGGRLYTLDTVRRVVDAQLEAIAGLAARFPLSVLIPALDRIEDFLAWRDKIETGFALRLPVGAMIETPTAALDIGRWLEAADFVAIGCNDLMQCLFGADRDLPLVGTVPDPYAPALYRFLSYVAEAAGDALARVELCGLLAQMPGVVTLLIGLGYRSFSADPLRVPHLARLVTQISTTHANTLALQAKSVAESGEVRALLGLPRVSIWTPAVP